jgi:hypothetical protein
MLAAALVLVLAVAPGSPARGGSEADAIGSPRRPVSRDGAHSPASPASGRSEGAGGWWLGTAGVALALAACGWASVAARRYLPRAADGTAALRVVGRTSLSPKHTVYLLDVGGRVLIVGAGPQGPPSLLGELTGDPARGASVAAAGGEARS